MLLNPLILRDFRDAAESVQFDQPTENTGNHRAAVVQRPKQGYFRLPMVIPDFAMFQSRVDATILREAEDALPGFPSPAGAL